MIINLIKKAKEVLFNSTESTLNAKNVQDAIEELNTTKQPLLTNPLIQADVVNQLGSTNTNKPLSANMGKVLNEGKLGFEDVLNSYPLSPSSLGDATRPISQQQATVTYRVLNNTINDLQGVRNRVSTAETNISSLNSKYSPDINLVSDCNNAPYGISCSTVTASNRPYSSTDYTVLITMKVANNDNFKFQIGLISTGPWLYVRSRWSGSWGAWTRIQ